MSANIGEKKRYSVRGKQGKFIKTSVKNKRAKALAASLKACSMLTKVSLTKVLIVYKLMNYLY